MRLFGVKIATTAIQARAGFPLNLFRRLNYLMVGNVIDRINNEPKKKNRVQSMKTSHTHSNTKIFQLTVFIHGRLKAFGKSACPALIPMSFVDGTAPFQIAGRFTRINAIPMDASFEETRTAVTTVNAIMFARASISAHFAWYIQKSVA